MGLVNDVYGTKLSEPTLEKISIKLLEVDSFEDYKYILQKFERCCPVIRKGKMIERNAFSLGTKLLHFYNPEENTILDSIVRNNLNLGEMDLGLCFEFKKAVSSFVEEHSDYFSRLKVSPNFLQELEKRHMTNQFPKMQIIDMALY